MRKYILTAERFKGQLLFGYNSDGILVLFENKAEMSTEQLKYLCKYFPVIDDLLPKMAGKGTITEVTDLSFNSFWDAYNHKVGDKAKSEKLWRQLNESERLAVLECLPKYNRYLKGMSIAKAYPTTFLNQKRWENEYKLK